MELAIMIEGQNGLNWGHWKRLARAVEDLGFVGLFRSDHFTNASSPDLDSLDLWPSLTWLASETKRIEFGPLVAPFSFRHPVMIARMGRDIDDLSGGRLVLGVGAGWQEREHEKFGFDLLPLKGRFDRFEEGVAVVHNLLTSSEPVSFEGEYYQLKDAMLLPRPQRQDGPPILIGGSGRRRTMPLAARYAHEWNTIFAPPARFHELNQHMNDLMAAAGRPPSELRRSMMTGTFIARSEAKLDAKLSERGRDRASLRERGVLVGVASEWVDQIAELEGSGVERIMLQWLDLEDLDGLELVASQVMPQVTSN